MQDDHPQGIFVFSAGFLVQGVDGPGKVQPVAVHIAHAEAQQLAGAQAGHYSQTIGVDVFIGLHFSTDDAGVGGKQYPQRIGL